VEGRQQLELFASFDDVGDVSRGNSGAGRVAIALAAALLLAWFAVPASAGATPRFAPYVDMTLNSDSLAKMKSESGVSLFTFGFIVSGQPCKASWGGYYGLDDPTMNQRIAKLKQAGGDGIVSFGGAAGQELADTCTTVDSLRAQYQAVINRYGIRNLDFDIEGADQANTASLTRRFKAIERIQAAGRAAGKPVHERRRRLADGRRHSDARCQRRPEGDLHDAERRPADGVRQAETPRPARDVVGEPRSPVPGNP
jgi:hypothetical protein